MVSKGGLLVDFITGIRDKMVWFFASFLNCNQGWNGVVFWPFCSNNKGYMSCIFMINCTIFKEWKKVWKGIILALFVGRNMDENVSFMA
jgi:hypothetical protein